MEVDPPNEKQENREDHHGDDHGAASPDQAPAPVAGGEDGTGQAEHRQYGQEDGEMAKYPHHPLDGLELARLDEDDLSAVRATDRAALEDADARGKEALVDRGDGRGQVQRHLAPGGGDGPVGSGLAGEDGHDLLVSSQVGPDPQVFELLGAHHPEADLMDEAP